MKDIKKYAVSFTGRLNGAIGITSRISDYIELPHGATKEEITLKLRNFKTNAIQYWKHYLTILLLPRILMC